MRSLRFRGWRAILLSAAIVLVVGAGAGTAACQFAVDCGIRPDAPAVDQFAGTGGGEMRLPTGFSWSTVASDLDFPSDFDFFPDGRVVISEKEGRMVLVKDGEVQAEPFLDLRSEVNSWFYRGVMNVTVDPDFPDRRYIYVVYSTTGDGANSSKPTTVRVSRFEVTGDVADPDSELVILGADGESSCATLSPGADCVPAEGDHVGADIVFASDGTMFVATGDGGGLGHGGIEQQAFSAQDRNTLAGKILHVDRDGRGLPGNPYWNGDPTSNRSKVWAQGFRNPFRIVSLPDDPETLLVAEVGGTRYDELDVVERGSDHGWPCHEGAERHVVYKPHAFCRRYYARPASPDGPWLAARHPSSLSISGGVPIDSATGWPDTFADRYIFGDWVKSDISTITLAVDAPAETPKVFATNAGGPVAFMLRPDGTLYYLATNLGELRRITPG